MGDSSQAPRGRRLRWWLGGALLVGALLAATVATQLRRDLPLETLRARWATGASRFITVEGMQVHYRDEGSGPAIVLLHGTAASLHTWDGWAAELSRRYRVVRFDLPGFGLTGPSPRRDYGIPAYEQFVHDVTTQLGLTRFAIAGNSLGGNIAWHFALAYHAMVSALILVDAGGYPHAGAPAPIAFRIARWPVVPSLLAGIDPQRLVADGLRKSYGDPGRIQPGVLDRYVDLALRPGNRAAFVDRMRTPAVDDSTLIHLIHQPALVLVGARDRVIDPDLAQRFARDIAGAKLVVYDDLGHIPMEEDPARTVRDVESFLAGVSGDAAVP